MGDVTHDIYNLRPVVFNYKTDANRRTEYGLIAEEVEELYPGIVIKDKEGKPETVQYHYLPLMMLNEMKKQQAVISRLSATICVLQEDIFALKVKNSRLE